jgi:HK97 family phage portal protein
MNPVASAFARLFQRQPQTKASSGVDWVGSPDFRTVFHLNGRSDITTETLTRHIAFATSAYCYAAMLWRAKRVAEPPLMVVRESADGEEWQPGHRLAVLFAAPRPDLDIAEILERTQMYRDLTGGALWTLDRNRLDDPAMITPFSADEFETESKGFLIYGGYRVRVQGGTMKPYKPEDVIHFRETNPTDWRTPVSKVDVALGQLDLGHNVNRIVRAFLTKAMFPGGIISPDENWHPDDKEWELWKSQVEAWYTGPMNQAAPLVVPGSTRFSPVNSGMANLLPESVMDRVEATVGSIFGTPPVVLGWLSGMQNSPWSQMSEARRQVYEDTIEPLWRDVERRLTRSLLSPEEIAAGYLVRFDTSDVRALQADQERQARISALASDTMKVNERRMLMGQDPLPPDDPRGEMITGIFTPAEPSMDLGVGDDEEEEPDETEADAAEEEAGKAAKTGADTKDLMWLVFDLSTKAHAPGWEATVYAHLQALKAKTLAAARRTLKEEKGVTPSSGRSFQLAMNEILDQDRPRLMAKTYPLVVRTGTTAVKRLASRLSLSFSVLEPGLLEYAGREAAFLARTMGKTTGEAVAAAVQAGLSEGETVGKLVKRLEQLPAFTRDRAKLVARTETTRAWNGSQRRSLEVYERESGKTATKSWLSSRDARVRDEHDALDDGTFIPIGDPFANGLQEPGEPNCRCTLLYGFTD